MYFEEIIIMLKNIFGYIIAKKFFMVLE